MQLIYENYFSENLYNFFRREYHIITGDKKDYYLDRWVNRWIVNYQKYKYNFPESDSICNGTADTLEELIDGGK